MHFHLNKINYNWRWAENIILYTGKYICPSEKMKLIFLVIRCDAIISIYGFCGFFSFAENQSSSNTSYNSGFQDKLFKLFYPGKFSMHECISPLTFSIHALTYLYAPKPKTFNSRKKINWEFSLTRNFFCHCEQQATGKLKTIFPFFHSFYSGFLFWSRIL